MTAGPLRRWWVRPVEGMGWTCADPGRPCWAVEPPRPFHLASVAEWEGPAHSRRGAGVIDEPGHVLDGLKVSYAARAPEAPLPDGAPGDCDVTIGSRLNAVDDPPGARSVEGFPALSGLARLEAPSR